ncbi:hypothetical protein [Metapseudomonas otitidis]|uniref:hypothetical protein n=1 Tax=Metapseudomonas otitidis TaxID=319939 RepID=UPI002449B6F0|nr:hypothetical protein [Pseudomonas otitidis]MDH0335170.1 hypothetical protein [Pseudomonas otitidis]
MNFRIDWIDGAPEDFEPGMMVEVIGKLTGMPIRILVGHISPHGAVINTTDTGFAVSDVIRYGYLIKPHELDWIADMAQRHGKGRPQE